MPGPRSSPRSDDTPVTEPRDRAPDDDLDSEDVATDDVEDERDDLDLEDGVDDLEDAGIDHIDDEGDDLDAGDEAEVDDYDAAVREIAGEAAPAAAATAAERRSSAARRRTPGKQASRAPTPSEVAVHVRENVSRTFVIAAVAIYIVILLNGIFLGTGGVFRPLPTPAPTPSESPSASPSSSASPSASTSASPTTSAPASPSTSAPASPSAS